MRQRVILAALAALLLASGAARADCQAKAIRVLKAASPDGYAIYRQASQPAFFRSWIDCADAQYDLSTAVHETTHLVTGERDAFPLVGGGEIARPHELSSLMPPWRIGAQFDSDDFTSVYLVRGRASSADDVLYLLDELDAYTHDLSAAVDLASLRAHDEVVDHRDGLAALMAFVAAYAETARATDPATWDGLQASRARATVATLWTQAERVMASSCGISDYGTRDKAYIARVCAAGPRSALAQIVGRAPVCPEACLAPEPPRGDDVSDANGSSGSVPEDADDDDRVTGSLPRHPFAIAASPRHHKPGDDE